MMTHERTVHDDYDDLVEVTLTGVEVDGMATIGFPAEARIQWSRRPSACLNGDL